MASIEMDSSEIDELYQIFEQYKESGLKAINDILHDQGGDIIQENIMPLIPVSGRYWKGKKAAASSAQPFTNDTKEMLAVTVRSKSAYNYLYFPDDGSNTKKHAGGLDFMGRGAEKSQDKIIDLCLGKLSEQFQ